LISSQRYFLLALRLALAAIGLVLFFDCLSFGWGGACDHIIYMAASIKKKHNICESASLMKTFKDRNVSGLHGRNEMANN
jgi:hypothetical protein